MSESASEFSIYTILHRDKLDQVFRDGGAGQFTEKRAWITGSRLFHNAVQAGQRMPIIFADAATTQGLIYYAYLTDVHVLGENNEGPTRYSFTGLTPIDGEPPKSTLRKRDRKLPLSDDNIRPYAVVYTPDFLRSPQ